MEKITIERYTLDNGFIIEIEESEDMYKTWLYYKTYGIKVSLSGMDKDNPMGFGRDEYIREMIAKELEGDMYMYKDDYLLYEAGNEDLEFHVDEEEIVKILSATEE